MAKTKAKVKRKMKKLDEPSWMKSGKKVAASSSGRRRMQLGNALDMAKKESFGSTDFKLDYKSADNVYALLSAEWEVVQDHWIELDNETERMSCAVHSLIPSDPSASDYDAKMDVYEEKADSTWGYPEGCKFCKMKKDFYENHSKDSADAVDKKGREIASKVGAKKAIYLKVVKGKLDSYRKSRKSNEVVTVPLFDEKALVGKRLRITDEAFNRLFESVKASGFKPEELVGMPFNMIGGRKQGNSFVIDRVELFPKEMIKKLPKSSVSFKGLSVYDSEKMDRVFKAFKELVPDYMSGKLKFKVFGSKSKPAPKSKKKVVRRKKK